MVYVGQRYYVFLNQDNHSIYISSWHLEVFFFMLIPQENKPPLLPRISNSAFQL